MSGFFHLYALTLGPASAVPAPQLATQAQILPPWLTPLHSTAHLSEATLTQEQVAASTANEALDNSITMLGTSNLGTAIVTDSDTSTFLFLFQQAVKCTEDELKSRFLYSALESLKEFYQKSPQAAFAQLQAPIEWIKTHLLLSVFQIVYTTEWIRMGEELKIAPTELSQKYYDLGLCYSSQNDFHSAIRQFLKALELIRDNPDQYDFTCTLLYEIAKTSEALGDSETESRYRQELLDTVRRNEGEGSIQFGSHMYDLAIQKKKLGDVNGAINNFHAVRKALSGHENVDTMTLKTLMELSELYNNQGDTEKANVCYSHIATLAQRHLDQYNLPKAIECYEGMCEIQEWLNPDDHESILRHARQLSWLNLKIGDTKRANEYAETILPTLEEMGEKKTLRVAFTKVMMGNISKLLELSEPNIFFEEAFSLFRELLDGENRNDDALRTLVKQELPYLDEVNVAYCVGQIKSIFDTQPS